MICLRSSASTFGACMPPGPTPPDVIAHRARRIGRIHADAGDEAAARRHVGIEQFAVDGGDAIGHRHRLLRHVAQRAPHVVDPDRQRELRAELACCRATSAGRSPSTPPRRANAGSPRTSRPSRRWSCRSCPAGRCACSALVPAPVPCVATVCNRLFIMYALRGSSVRGALRPAVSGSARGNHGAARIGRLRRSDTD